MNRVNRTINYALLGTQEHCFLQVKSNYINYPVYNFNNLQINVNTLINTYYLILNRHT